MMSTESTNQAAGNRASSPLQSIFAGLTSGVNSSDLDLVARTVISVYQNLPGVEAVAVAADPDRAALLDPAWNRRHKPCLGWWRGCAQPRWLGLPGKWQGLISTIPAAGIAVGLDKIPGGSPWPDAKNGGPDINGWILAPVRSGDKVMLAVLVGVNRNPALEAVTTSAVQDLQMVLNPLVESWSEVVALKWKLNQAENKNRALTHLNRLQGRFVAMASHELKTPLTSITAYSDALQSQITDEDFPHATEFIGVIRAESGRLLRMVNRILDFSRMEYGLRLEDQRPRDLEPLVRDTVRSLKPASLAKNHTVTVEADLSLPRAEIDADLIRQVLINLIGNAIKYTPAGGQITVSLHEVASAVEVQVQDNGPGIPVNEQRRIFGEFIRSSGTTGNEEGTGLGLSIARHIVHLHGGTISAKSGLGGGSLFSFSVPKEILLPVELAKVWTHATGKSEAQTLLRMLLRLLAEYTGSRSASLYFKNQLGELAPVAILGHEEPGHDLVPWIIDEQWEQFLAAGQCCLVDDAPRSNNHWQPRYCRIKGQALVAAIGSADEVVGCLLLGRPQNQAAYGPDQVSQARVLAQVAWTALVRLAGLQKNEMGERFVPRKIIEALGVLLETHHVGIPTGTAEAFALLERLAQKQGLNESQIRRLQYAAALHDAGMARLEEDIIWGTAELSLDERDEVDRHVDLGVDLMAPLLSDLELARIIRHHHERYDGTGHPDGLKGEDIPVESRLLAITDAWFSLTCCRPFRPGTPPVEALQEIKLHAGRQFSQKIVADLEQALTELGLLVDSLHPTG